MMTKGDSFEGLSESLDHAARGADSVTKINVLAIDIALIDDTKINEKQSIFSVYTGLSLMASEGM